MNGRLRFRWQGREKSIATKLPDTPENRKVLKPVADMDKLGIDAPER